MAAGLENLWRSPPCVPCTRLCDTANMRRGRELQSKTQRTANPAKRRARAGQERKCCAEGNSAWTPGPEEKRNLKTRALARPREQVPTVSRALARGYASKAFTFLARLDERDGAIGHHAHAGLLEALAHRQVVAHAGLPRARGAQAAKLCTLRACLGKAS